MIGAEEVVRHVEICVPIGIAIPPGGRQAVVIVLPDSRSMEVWRSVAPGEGTTPQQISQATRLEGGPQFPGLAINLLEIWAA
jgi:hypothetical protein